MNKIRELRKKQDIKQTDLCKLLGISQGTLSGWENGKYEPDNKSLIRLSEILGVTVDYLLGRGENYKEVQNKNFKIPVLGYVAAGIPIEAVEDILDFEELDPLQFDPNFEYFGLKIKGDSMTPRIQNGDVVIVRRQPDVESGEVAIVAEARDHATCKQIRKHQDGIALVPFNNAYDIRFFTNSEIEEKPVVILGKVVELRGKF